MTTSFLPLIPELQLLGVFDPGVPRRERIVLKVEAQIDIGWYAIILAIRGQPSGHIAPLRDSMYWIGSGSVQPNDWIFLFTGSGQQITLPAEGDHGKLFVEFWGREETVFHNSQIVPVLWRLSGITVEKADPTIPALPLG
jgi:hypothetical protein